MTPLDRFQQAPPRDQRRVGVLVLGWLVVVVVMLAGANRPNSAHWVTEHCSPFGQQDTGFWRCQGYAYRINGETTLTLGDIPEAGDATYEVTWVLAVERGTLTVELPTADGPPTTITLQPGEPHTQQIPMHLKAGAAQAHMRAEGSAERFSYLMCFTREAPSVPVAFCDNF